jgi:Tol biopolymer transport system component
VRLNPELPPRLEDIINKSLEKDRNLRYQHAADVRTDLQRLRRDTGSGKIAPAETGSAASASGVSGIASQSSQSVATAAVKPSRKIWIGVGAALAMVLLALGLIYWKHFWHGGLAENGFHDLKITSLSFSGDIVSSEISPDGKYLAYVSDPHGKYSLWVRQIETGSAVQIFASAGDHLWGPVFSPDANYLDYLAYRGGTEHGSIYAIPTLGGTPRLLIDPADSTVSFSPDGNQVAYTLHEQSAGQSRIMVANRDGSATHQVASEEAIDSVNTVAVRWSPDGKRLALVRADADDPGGLGASLSEVDLATGKVHRMTGKRWRSIRDFTWLPDGSGLLLAALNKSGAPDQIWVVTYPGGERRRLSNDLMTYETVSVSGDGKSIVGTQWDTALDLWAAPSDSPDAARQITSGWEDGGHGFTILPDNRIVYTGDHSENWDLFMSDMDGQNTRQLTFDGRFHDSPTVCENGQSVVYATDSLGVTHLWKLDLKSGSSVQLTRGDGEWDPACAPNGDTIYYVGRVAGKESVFKMAAAGGVPVPIFGQEEIRFRGVSLDGKHLLLVTQRQDRRATYITISTATGETESEYPVPPTTWFGTGWMPDNRSVAAGDTRSGAINFWALPVLGGGPEKQITHFTTPGEGYVQYSPDGKWFVMVRGPSTRNAVLFREAAN